MREAVRTIFILFLSAIALLLLIVGLIAPLTPSEGTPKIWELFLFIALPIVLPIIGMAISKKGFEKRFCIVVELVVILIAIWWAWTIGRFLWRDRGEKLSFAETVCIDNHHLQRACQNADL
jgi:hypothetical protein